MHQFVKRECILTKYKEEGNW